MSVMTAAESTVAGQKERMCSLQRALDIAKSQASEKAKQVAKETESTMRRIIGLEQTLKQVEDSIEMSTTLSTPTRSVVHAADGGIVLSSEVMAAEWSPECMAAVDAVAEKHKADAQACEPGRRPVAKAEALAREPGRQSAAKQLQAAGLTTMPSGSAASAAPDQVKTEPPRVAGTDAAVVLSHVEIKVEPGLAGAESAVSAAQVEVITKSDMEDGPDSPSIAAQDARANDGLDLDIGADDMHMLPVANSSGARTRKTKSARNPGRKIAKASTGQAQRATTSTRTSGRAHKSYVALG
jgi:hypothetical protein